MHDGKSGNIPNSSLFWEDNIGIFALYYYLVGMFRCIWRRLWSLIFVILLMLLSIGLYAAAVYFSVNSPDVLWADVGFTIFTFQTYFNTDSCLALFCIYGIDL